MVFSPGTMPKMSFPNYLRQALSGTSQVQVAAKVGLTRPVLNRLLKGERPPTAMQVLKLAVFLNEHPARLFDLAGDYGTAELCRALIPEEQDDAAYELCRRVRRLARRGMTRHLDQALGGLELLWETALQGFEELAQSMGCESACLVADHRVEGDVLYRWQVSEEEAERLARDRQGQGWRRFTRPDPHIGLDLFVRGGKPNRTHIELCLSNWASSLSVAVRER